MKLSNTLLVACMAFLPVALAADYRGGGCSSKNEGESKCTGFHHKRINRCYKGMWRNYQCPGNAGCYPLPFPRCGTYDFSWMVKPSANLTVATNVTLPTANSTAVHDSTKLPVNQIL